MSELIDTLWNVNVPALPQPLRCAEELIDTLWNVNKAALTLSGSKSGN